MTIRTAIHLPDGISPRSQWDTPDVSGVAEFDSNRTVRTYPYPFSRELLVNSGMLSPGRPLPMIAWHLDSPHIRRSLPRHETVGRLEPSRLHDALLRAVHPVTSSARVRLAFCPVTCDFNCELFEFDVKSAGLGLGYLLSKA
jgi:hypothetical protein